VRIEDGENWGRRELGAEITWGRKKWGQREPREGRAGGRENWG